MKNPPNASEVLKRVAKNSAEAVPAPSKDDKTAEAALNQARQIIAEQMNRNAMNVLSDNLARSLVEIESLKAKVADLEQKLSGKLSEKA